MENIIDRDKPFFILLLTITLFFAIVITFIYFSALLKEIDYSYNVVVVHKEKVYNKIEVTMYNVGVKSQTDGSPCIGASGDNICTIIADDTNVCATNMLPIHTIINIKGLGNCVILDTMNSRYKNRIDWALPADKVTEAKKFGVQKLEYTILLNNN